MTPVIFLTLMYVAKETLQKRLISIQRELLKMDQSSKPSNEHTTLCVLKVCEHASFRFVPEAWKW